MPSVHIQMLSFSAVDGCYLMRGEKDKILFHRLPLGKAQEWHLVPFFIFFSDAAVTSGECS